MAKFSRSKSEFATDSPEELIEDREAGREPRHLSSLTAIAEQALRSGVVDPPPPGMRDEIPGEAVLRAGDPEVSLLDNEYSGDEVAGGSTPTPDQNNIDDIGRAYGLTDEDSGDLVAAEQLLARRDRHRWELDPRSKDVER
jgi:hypothetical protein